MNADLMIPNAGSDLYKYGLSLFPYESVERNAFRHPIWMFLVLTGYCVKLVVSLVVDSSDTAFALYTGDFFFFFGSRQHIRMGALIYGFLAIVSQIIHFWYYWKGIEPTYLRPLLAMAGLVSPQSIGLTGKRDVQRLAVRARIHLWLARVVLKSGIPLAAGIAGLPTALESSCDQFFFFGLPSILIFVIWVHYSAAFFLFQVNYFLIICYYLKLKVINLNIELNELKNSPEEMILTPHIKRIVIAFDDIHKEVMEFNDNHWSLYLFVLIAHVILITNLLLFAIFGRINTIIKILFIYVIIIFIVFISYILVNTSSVARLINKSYHTLNSLYVKKVVKSRSKANKVKVFRLR